MVFLALFFNFENEEVEFVFEFVFSWSYYRVLGFIFLLLGGFIILSVVGFICYNFCRGRSCCCYFRKGCLRFGMFFEICFFFLRCFKNVFLLVYVFFGKFLECIFGFIKVESIL